ncbi:MAG: FKBP-type peptidyl-prolyl cis-trans isomerase [Cyclobacteriaceae bacterium]
MKNYSTYAILLAMSVAVLIASCSDDNLTIVDSEIPFQSSEDSLAQLDDDNALIDAYLSENAVEEIFNTSNGSRYYLLQEGNGTVPELNDIVSINFIGRYLDGTVFDSNIESVADPDVIGKSNNNFDVWRFNYTVDGRQLGFSGQYSYLNLIPELKRGIGAALGLMDEGSSTVIILPSAQALGPFGFDNNDGFAIPVNTVLLFEIGLVQVRTN